MKIDFARWNDLSIGRDVGRAMKTSRNGNRIDKKITFSILPCHFQPHSLKIILDSE